MGYPVLVPRRDDNGERDALWGLLKDDLWESEDVYEGYHTTGPFNRSAAINSAASEAGIWSCAVVADADTYIDKDRLLQAIDLANDTQKLVIPHSRWVNVEMGEVDRFMDTKTLQWKKGRDIYALTVSSILVVPRTVWDIVNGFDERFSGWGWEDTAFMQAVDVMTDGHIRLEGDVYHLAHDRPAADTNRTLDSGYIRNTNHYRNLYKRARTRSEMKRVINGNRVTL